MNKLRVLVVVILTSSGFAGCATTRTQDLARTGAAVQEKPEKQEKLVSKPAASYGSMGGYRYRRLVSVNLTSG